MSHRPTKCKQSCVKNTSGMIMVSREKNLQQYKHLKVRQWKLLYWLKYLKSNTFPLAGKNKLIDRHLYFNNGENVSLIDLKGFDDLYGILAEIKFKGKNMLSQFVI